MILKIIFCYNPSENSQKKSYASSHLLLIHHFPSPKLLLLHQVMNGATFRDDTCVWNNDVDGDAIAKSMCVGMIYQAH